jgi:hypothetical protein
MQLAPHDELPFLEVERFECQGSASQYCFAVWMPIWNRHNAQRLLDKSAEITWAASHFSFQRATV